jgi:D-alanine-D-alanine ligase-like ATP-grasp enzyme
MNQMIGIDNGLDKGMAYVNEMGGYPVYVKPNDLDGGELVVKVYSWNELRSVALYIFDRTDTLLVEKVAPGRDYRVLVYDGKVEAAYERVPLGVVGDGKSTVGELAQKRMNLLKKQEKLRRDFDPDDLTIFKVLRRSRVDRENVLAPGVRVNLLENASLGTGGEAIDLSQTIHPGFAEIALKAAAALGLKFAGVDILAADLTQAPETQEWAILELNSTPALSLFYELGPRQREQVEAVYRKILLGLVKG